MNMGNKGTDALNAFCPSLLSEEIKSCKTHSVRLYHSLYDVLYGGGLGESKSFVFVCKAWRTAALHGVAAASREPSRPFGVLLRYSQLTPSTPIRFVSLKHVPLRFSVTARW